MKKFLAMFMAGYLCVSLAACGSGEGGGKEPLGEHKHIYTAKSECDLCGEAWNATETDAYTFTPITLDGIAGYDVTFGVFETRGNTMIDPTTGEIVSSDRVVTGKPYNGEEIVLPCVHEGKPVISVGNRFPASSATVKKITLPDSIFSFGADHGTDIYYIFGYARAFVDCNALEELVLPYEVNLGGTGFSDAMPFSHRAIDTFLGTTPPIQNNVAEDGGLYIDDYLVSVSDVGTSFRIREGTKGIASEVFYGSDLEEVYIPDSVVEIGYNAFAGLAVGIDNPQSPLKKVTFGENSKLKKIDMAAFQNCLSLTEIEFPDGLEEIGSSAFGLTGLREIEIPEGVTTIGERAFEKCVSLEKIIIPKSVTSLGVGALDCGVLKEIEFGGTAEEWKALCADGGSYMILGSADVTITCSDGKLDKDGNVITE